MGKKRKTSGKEAPSRDEPKHAASEPRTKLNLRSYEDVADSEDEFFLNRDQILLDEGPARKKLRQLEEEDAFFQPSDEEVLPVPSSGSEDEEDYEDAVDVQDEDDIGEFRSRTRKDESDEEEGISGWGDARRDYYDGDRIETEADALEEEKEALRLQKKQLQGMTAADYGFDEAEWLQDGDTGVAPGGSKVLQEVLPELEISDAMKDEERAKILSTRYPEFAPLSKEFTNLRPAFEALDIEASKVLQNGITDMANFTDELPPSVVKRNVLGSYLGSLAMYFAILTSGTKGSTGQQLAKAPSEMRDHPIMETLVATRGLWEKIKDVDLPEPVPRLQDLRLQAQATDTNGEAQPTESIAEVRSTKTKKRSRKSAAQLEAEQALQQAEALRLQRMRRVEADLAKLSAPTRPSKSQPSKSTLPTATARSDSGSEFGEADAITAEEAEEKAQRKRGLRFYTSKITAKGMKRERATRERGGDTDIPHRERLRDRQIRLNEEAERRGAKADARVQLDAEAESDDEDRTARAALRQEAGDDDDDDYYDMVAAQSQQKKAAKTAAASARQEDKIAGRTFEDGEQVGPDGKRNITYAIAKNKGLTPKRKKEGRNPRVKKRNQYEEKKKKLVNQRPVYKGGEGRGGYGGEKTGIRKNLVKSVKL